MVDHRHLKVAYGVIMRALHDPAPIERFLDNADSHRHPIDRVIVATSHGVDERAVEILKRRTNLNLVRALGDEELVRKLENGGVSPGHARQLLGSPDWDSRSEVPYGAYRNAVLIEAVLEGMDYLLYFDSDVYPRVLTDLSEGQCTWQEIDFVDSHLKTLSRSDVLVTTSDYSGYYIIPPLQFDGLKAFLFGLGKGMALEYMEECQNHSCLILGPDLPSEPRPTNKPLGGNLGLSLDRLDELAPFFSVVYDYDGLCIKGRGEDTLLGQALRDTEGAMQDIDLRVFHETYIDFPRFPDVQREPIRDRFYNACLGWIGRNPFMTWFLDQAGSLEKGFREEIGQQRRGLKSGGRQAAIALDDARFAKLADAFEASYAMLPDAIDRYMRLVRGWRAFLGAFSGGSRAREGAGGGGGRPEPVFSST